MKIQKPCFWYIKGTDVEDKIVSASCVECRELAMSEDPNGWAAKAWYWAGDEEGYGDYDLDCSFCNTPINKREHEIKTSI
jgi:hypothetical protein